MQWGDWVGFRKKLGSEPQRACRSSPAPVLLRCHSVGLIFGLFCTGGTVASKKWLPVSCILYQLQINKISI